MTLDKGDDSVESCPIVKFNQVHRQDMKSPGVTARIHLVEGQAISFVLREDIPNHVTPDVTTAILDARQHDTMAYWSKWLAKDRKSVV